MVSFRECVERWIGRRNSPPPNDEDKEEREKFKLRYWKFKSLLERNQRFLEAMADLECLAEANQPFGMGSIRAKAAALSVSAFQIIELLDAVAARKHDGLRRALERIQERISLELDVRPDETSGPVLLVLDRLTREDSGQVGAKMAVLGEIKSKLGLRVPDGFVLTSRAYRCFMEQNDLTPRINQQLQSTPPGDLECLYETTREIQGMIMDGKIPEKIRAAMDEAAADMEQRLGEGARFSVRSSALGEDGPGFSFAGQHRTCLDVARTDLGRAYKDVIAGKYSARAVAYRQATGSVDEDVLMCVGIMAMIDAKSAGVAYSRDPSAPHADKVVINAALGTGAQVVDGSAAPEEISLERLEARWRFRPAAQDAPDLEPACLSWPQCQELARTVRLLEEHFHAPQDVEWAFDQNGALWVLQSRDMHPGVQALDSPVAREAADPTADSAADSANPPAPLLRGGVTASPGAAHGPSRIIAGAEDAALTRAGDILVLDNALPRWAAILDKAAGVVARHGGVANHLATVAREYGVPALFNAGAGIDVLEPGLELTLDADNRVVYPGRVESVLRIGRRKRPNLIRDSPVHATLLRVLKQVAPLRLLDPDSPDFSQPIFNSPANNSIHFSILAIEKFLSGTTSSKIC